MKSDPIPSKNPETLELMKERFSAKLTDILYEKLTVENIETFADEALDNIIDLTSNILDYYKNSGNLEVHNELELKDQEDDAYTQLGLPKISNILDLIEEKKNEIDKIKDKIKKEYIDTVITPPQENEGGIIPGDGNGIEKKKLLPRLLTLMYILENDLEIDLENVNITEGKVYDNMMRKTPYVRVEVSDLDRLVYICDEEGNASYVFDTEKLKNKRISHEDLDIDNKGDKNSLIAMHPGIGVRIVQTKNWRDRVKSYLENEIPEVGEGKDMLGEVEEFEGEKVESEFKKQKKGSYISYDDFISELKSEYERENPENITNIIEWFSEKSKKHKNWYKGNLNTIARKRYGVSAKKLYEAIGHESRQYQGEHLPYDTFILELKNIYEQTDKKDISEFDKWYESEAKKHQGWYRGHLHGVAKKYGVKKEDIFKIIGHKKKIEFQESYLPYDEFIEQLKKAYTENDGIIINFENWYYQEVPKHKGWYKLSISDIAKRYGVSADDIYNFIGHERVRTNKAVLPYKDYIDEVRVIFEKNKDSITDINQWYKQESAKHDNWYHSGFNSVSEGYKINIKKIWEDIGYTPKKIYQETYLSFDEFIKELKTAFEASKDEVTNFNKWYRTQVKKHKGWYGPTSMLKKFNVSIQDIYKLIGYTPSR